jgi:hypothetical protein
MGGELMTSRSSQREPETPTADVDVVAVATRVTVGIVPSAAAALEKLMRRLGLNRTDVINRAITVYALVDDHISNGYELVFRDPETGKERLVTII